MRKAIERIEANRKKANTFKILIEYLIDFTVSRKSLLSESLKYIWKIHTEHTTASNISIT
jgi:hypothetical protein